MEKTILYFEHTGKSNTDATLEICRKRAEELGIRQVVLASTHGFTAKRAKEIFAGMDVELIAVTICGGYQDKGWTMTKEERSELQGLGITVLTCTHALGDDINDAMKFPAPNAVVRETLYTFCQGMKVAIEVALMAADADLLEMDREIIAVAGTGEGADTALVLRPAYPRKFQRLRIREILAKPR